MLVAKAFVVVTLVRFALLLLPFRIVHRLVGARASSPRPASQTVPVDQIVHAVTTAAPRAACLAQALAASLLLRRYGHDATLRVGVAKDVDGRVHAHAWLESAGVTVLGEPEAGTFQPLS